jgi:hypothetical protein
MRGINVRAAVGVRICARGSRLLPLLTGGEVMKNILATASIASALLLSLPGTASAQDAPQEAPPDAPRPRYMVPLEQHTQPSYVPQSVALSGPRVIGDWEEGQDIPPGYHVSTRVRKGPVIAGAVVFGLLYLFSTLAAAIDSEVNSGSGGPLLVPAIGPFIQMGSTSDSIGTWALAVDGLAQTGGLALLIYGIAAPKTVLVRNDLGLRIEPRVIAVGRSGTGLGLVGSF